MDNKDESSTQTKMFRLAEYTSLRSEIVERIKIEFQLIFTTVVALGSFITVALSKDRPDEALFILLFPLLVVPMALAYSRQEYGVLKISRYLRDVTEKELLPTTESGWESTSLRDQIENNNNPLPLRRTFGPLTFLFSQVIALLIAMYRLDWRGWQDISTLLYGFNVTAILLVLYTFRRHFMPVRQQQNTLSGSQATSLSSSNSED
jgi:hypothetical protein